MFHHNKFFRVHFLFFFDVAANRRHKYNLLIYFINLLYFSHKGVRLIFYFPATCLNHISRLSQIREHGNTVLKLVSVFNNTALHFSSDTIRASYQIRTQYHFLNVKSSINGKNLKLYYFLF